MTKEEEIIICPEYIANKEINNNPFLNRKYYRLNEFINKYIYKYKDSTLYYISNKYNMLPSNAKIIMDNLYYIENALNDKTKYLLDIKEDLIKNNYIIYNKYFTHFIKNKKINVIGYSESKYLKNLFKNLNSNFIKNKEINKKFQIYKFHNIEEEVVFLATNISKLINKGIDINKIKIRKEEEYINTINKIFPLFNIPYELNSMTSLFSLNKVKDFLNNIDDNKRINELQKDIDSLGLNSDIQNKLVNIINKYTDINPTVKEFKPVLIYELKNNYIKNKSYTNCVEFIDIYNYDLSDITLFLIGFNQNSIPIIYKDEDFLTDKEKDLLKIDNSYDNNKLEKEKIINILNTVNDIYISYKEETPFNKYNISNVVDDIDYEITSLEYDFSNKEYNKLLYSYKLDELLKYNIKDNITNNLYTNTQIEYNTYSNLFNGINLKEINLNLSTTNMEQFFKCQFSFYINYILKLDTFEETTYIKIGNLFHKILEEVYKNKVEKYEDIIDKYLLEYFPEQTLKQQFYNQKYKNLIIDIINIINSFDTNFENIMFEEWFSVPKTNNIKVVGKIDKIMSLEKEINNIAVIDYKTGFLHADFNKAKHGFDMQLLVYLYLIKNSYKIKNPRFVGMYLMPILYDTFKSDKDKSYKEIIENNMKLFGYSNTDLSILSEFDKNLENSFIQSMKLKKDNSFYAYSKVLNDSEIEELLKIVDKNINEVIDKINKSDFKINPKRLGKNNVSCTFCKFKDLCYMTNNDIVNLKEYKNLEFLGSDNND
ncbi:MAG: PD-(D/E)XK nuclease family protein [Bacilli bacterium]|nr:PD-(D/E)XK nuclease family protein [Bacilli bacterium]